MKALASGRPGHGHGYDLGAWPAGPPTTTPGIHRYHVFAIQAVLECVPSRNHRVASGRQT
jgi:hypothetical protein